MHGPTPTSTSWSSSPSRSAKAAAATPRRSVSVGPCRQPPVARDILVYSRDDIEQWRGSLNHVAARALREGRVVYARGWGVPSPSRPCTVRDGGRPQPDIEQARLLLGMADGDIGALRVMLSPDDVTDEIFGFHVQQAAEKCLKAWIAMLGEEYPLTHELDVLIEMIRRQDAAVAGHADLVRFNPFGVKYRYGPFPEDDGPIDRPGAIQQVEALMRRVRHLIPGREPPTG